MTNDDDYWDELDYWDWVDEDLERLFGVRLRADDVIIEYIIAAEAAGETSEECARKLGEKFGLDYLDDGKEGTEIFKRLPRPICIGCNLHPEELKEYVQCARTWDSRMSVEQYVRQQEGTYNPENGHFLCSDCYIKAGSPSSREGWKAP